MKLGLAGAQKTIVSITLSICDPSSLATYVNTKICFSLLLQLRIIMFYLYDKGQMVATKADTLTGP